MGGGGGRGEEVRRGGKQLTSLFLPHPQPWTSFFLNPTKSICFAVMIKKKGKRKVQGVPQSQIAALPRHQEEEEIDKFKQAQIEQTYEKH